MRLWPPARRDRHRPLRIGVMGKGNHDIAPSTIVHLCDDPCDDDDDDVDAASLRSAADPYRLQFLSPPAPDRPPERRRHAHMRVAHTGRQLRKRMNACANGGGRKEGRKEDRQSAEHYILRDSVSCDFGCGGRPYQAKRCVPYFLFHSNSNVTRQKNG